MASRFFRWLTAVNSDRRIAPRVPGEGLAAFYWEGDAPRGHGIRDISTRGAFLETDSLAWPQGTSMILTLQIDAKGPGDPAAVAVAVEAEVVRTTPQGMGLKFLFADVEEWRSFLEFLSQWNPNSVAFGAHRGQAGSDRQGQSLVEFCLIFPVLFLLVVNVVNFGTFMYAWITVSNAARAGAQYWITGEATVYTPSTPTAAQVTAVITNEVASLPNKSSVAVEVCTNNNGTTSCSAATYAAPAADPEAPHFVSASVDVKYTYLPMIALWSFPSLHVFATMPPTTIHRRAVMRVMN